MKNSVELQRNSKHQDSKFESSLVDKTKHEITSASRVSTKQITNTTNNMYESIWANYTKFYRNSVKFLISHYCYKLLLILIKQVAVCILYKLNVLWQFNCTVLCSIYYIKRKSIIKSFCTKSIFLINFWKFSFKLYFMDCFILFLLIAVFFSIIFPTVFQKLLFINCSLLP